MGDIAACVAHLAPRGPVFIVGYCYGGTMSWLAASRVPGIAAASSYYGGGVASMAGLPLNCPVICHLGRLDGHIPADEVQAKVAATHPEVPVHIYEASGHGFNNDGVEAQNPADAALARARTLALFESNGAL
jgi:carboxymethylenebutenolidase